MRWRVVGMVVVGLASCALVRDLKRAYTPSPAVGTLNAPCEPDGGCGEGECVDLAVEGPWLGKHEPRLACVMRCEPHRPCPDDLFCVYESRGPARCERPSVPIGTLGQPCRPDGGCLEGACVELDVDRKQKPHRCLLPCNPNLQCPQGFECNDERPQNCRRPKPFEDR